MHSGGCHQRHRRDVPAEAAVAVVVLSVDVRRDGAANGHTASPGGDRNESPLRQDFSQELVDAHPGADGHESTAAVNRTDRVESGHVEDEAARPLPGVAVAPPQATRDHAPTSGAVQELHDLVAAARGDHIAHGSGRPSPTGQATAIDRERKPVFLYVHRPSKLHGPAARLGCRWTFDTARCAGSRRSIERCSWTPLVLR